VNIKSEDYCYCECDAM